MERLAHQLADEVLSADAENREVLRDYAGEILRAETAGGGQSAVAPAPRRPVGPLALAFLLLLAGGLFVVVLPPVGVILLLMAVVTFGWGLVRLAVPGGRAGPTAG